MRMTSPRILICAIALVGATLKSGSALAQGAEAQPCASAPAQEGCGTYMWPDGSKYVGGFHGGYPDGPATIYFADESRLGGTFFSSGGALGDVTYTTADGTRITGGFHDPSKDVTKPHSPVIFPF